MSVIKVVRAWGSPGPGMQLIEALPEGLCGAANLREARQRWGRIEEGLDSGVALFMSIDRLALRGHFRGRLCLNLDDGDHDTAYLQPFADCRGQLFLTSQYARG